MVEFTWQAGFEAKKEVDTSDPFRIKGVLVDASVNKNRFRIDEPEFPFIEKQVTSGTLRIDHGKSVRDVIGGFTDAKWNPETKQLMFEAEIDDPQIQMLAKKGRIKFISIGASADAFCSECGKPAGPYRACKCKGAHDVIKNVKFKEGSIVLEPAYEKAEWSPTGFMASLNTALGEYKEPEVTPDSTVQPVEGGKHQSKVEDTNMSETPENKTEVKATSQMSAGPNAYILLAEQLKNEIASIKSEMATMKSESNKKESEEKTKTEALSTKLDAILSKLETKEPKKEKKPDEDEEKKETDEDEENEDEDEKKREKCKKVTPVKAGAKVENPESVVQADNVRYGVKVPSWMAEIVDKATKEGWFES